MPLRGDAKDAPAPGILLAVPTDHRVVPVADENGSVGRDGYIHRSYPLVPLALEEVHSVGRITRADLLGDDPSQDARTGIGREDLVPEFTRQQPPLVGGHSGWRPGSRDQQVRDDSRIVLVPVPLRHLRVHSGALGLVSRSGQLVAIPVVPPFDDVVQAAGVASVVIVVRLPQAAQRIDGDLVVVAEVVSEDFQFAAVRVASKHHPTLEAASKFLQTSREFRSLGIRSGTQGLCVIPVQYGLAESVDRQPPVLVMDIPTGIAHVPVQLAIGTERQRVRRVIVLWLPGPHEEALLAVGNVVAVLVGEDDHVRRGRHDHLVAEHRDAQRRVDVTTLVVDFRRVRDSVAVGVLQNQDPVTLGPSVVPSVLAVIDDIAHPYAAAMIDVDVGGIGERRLRREQGCCESRVDIDGS